MDELHRASEFINSRTSGRLQRESAWQIRQVIAQMEIRITVEIHLIIDLG